MKLRIDIFCNIKFLIFVAAATPLHVHNDLFLPNFLTTVTLASPKYELPDDGHRPKHVGTF
jgi:hypothetical protein